MSKRRTMGCTGGNLPDTARPRGPLRRRRRRRDTPWGRGPHGSRRPAADAGGVPAARTLHRVVGLDARRGPAAGPWRRARPVGGRPAAGLRHRDQPPALLAADHTPRGRRCGNRGGVRDGESVRWPGCGGSVIRHVAPGAVGALPIAPRAPTPWNSPSGRRPVVSAADPSPSARRVTAAMPTARRGAARPLGAGRFEPPTPVISAVPKGASTTEISDWTTSLNRGTTARTRLGLSEFGAVTRVRWAQPGPHPTSESALYAIRTPCRPPTPRPWTPALPMDAKSAPQGAWKTAKNAVSHSAHSHLQDLHEKTAAGAERTGGCREFVSSSRLLTGRRRRR